MWRFLAGVGSALALVAAGLFLFRSNAATEKLPPPPAMAAAMPEADAALPDDSPAATARTREQKRFDRYDKDRDGRITRDEYLASRRKAYTKLDTNGDGRLSFDEWAAKTATKFTTADKGRDGALDSAEFATTAVKRKPKRRVECPPATTTADDS
ncbi:MULTISPECIES: EF-hand domain-containing protein [unclassified Sphingomonas]|uniref:EF-hand domain-containing protein n=1 Tax=unclassified Sphingomonas TaxID=196159 RepID=UPI0006FCEBE5|nr:MULTISPECIES: EF-hand domain-containing protein [unclassified Sphingomonas]KQM66831.1 histidine kinase [Sphingomonas sp. Leaf16]KQN17779.1 histidine kinase [Sphingomonas sp. Leaf29]KQN23641.1 histidine kinase [Sphingomonas sp. Leaf32]